MTQSLVILSYIFLCISQLRNFMHNILPILFYILSHLGYNRYYIRNKSTRNTILKNLDKYEFICNRYDENQEPCGTCIHKNIIPEFIFVSNSEHCQYYIFCRKSIFVSLTRSVNNENVITLNEDFVPESEDTDDDDETKKISYMTKSGEYGYFQYKFRQIDLYQITKQTDIHMFAQQSSTFKKIMNFYQHNNYCKVFLSGSPGCGKTYFAYLMAQKLGCYLCDVFDPFEPSSNFNEIYTMTKIDSRRPLILLLDEVDILLNKIHNNKNDDHKKFSREIHNKTTWNNFMDKIEFGLFPYVIVIMNSNKHENEINRLDTSYLRKGRINIIQRW